MSLSRPKLTDYSLEVPQKVEKFDISAFDQRELLALRAKVDSKLQGLSLDEVNLVKETLLQFQAAKVLQADAADEDSGTPMNQRAQVQNSIANILSTLGKIQMELYDSEKLKRLTAATVKAVKLLSPEAQKAFFEAFQADLEQVEAEATA